MKCATDPEKVWGVDLTQDTVDPNVPTLPLPMPPAHACGVKMETPEELAADARIKKEAKVDARIKKEAEETAAAALAPVSSDAGGSTAAPAPAATTGTAPAAAPMFQFGSVAQQDARGVQHPIDTMTGIRNPNDPVGVRGYATAELLAPLASSSEEEVVLTAPTFAPVVDLPSTDPEVAADSDPRTTATALPPQDVQMRGDADAVTGDIDAALQQSLDEVSSTGCAASDVSRILIRRNIQCLEQVEV
jgi:hypothetical protein